MACCLSSASRSFGFFRRGDANSSSKAGCDSTSTSRERVAMAGGAIRQAFLLAAAKAMLAYCKTLALSVPL